MNVQNAFPILHGSWMPSLEKYVGVQSWKAAQYLKKPVWISLNLSKVSNAEFSKNSLERPRRPWSSTILGSLSLYSILDYWKFLPSMTFKALLNGLQQPQRSWRSTLRLNLVCSTRNKFGWKIPINMKNRR